MNGPIRPSVGALLGQFSDAMTAVVNDAFGGSWADNDEIIVLTELILRHHPPVRDLAAEASMPRHVLTHLLERLGRAGLVNTSRTPTDRRVVTVTLTALGEERATELRRTFANVIRDARPVVEALVTGLGGPDEDMPSTAAQSDPVALLGWTARTGQELVRSVQAAGSAPISGRQRAALVQIVSTPGARPVDIGAAQSISRQNTGYVVDQLVEAGLVVRRPGAVPNDRRAVTLEATAAGRAVLGAVDHAIAERRDDLLRLFTSIRNQDDETEPTH